MFCIVKVGVTCCEVLDTEDGVVDVFDTNYLVSQVRKYNIHIEGLAYDDSNFNLEPVAYDFSYFSNKLLVWLDGKSPEPIVSIKFIRFNDEVTITKYVVKNRFYLLSKLNSYLGVYVRGGEVIVATTLDKVIASNMKCMFSNLTNLRELDLRILDTIIVSNMNEVFHNCFNLKSLDLGNFNTSNVVCMTDMFSGCISLVSLDLSSFDTRKVEFMDFMFNECSRLTHLDLFSFDTSNVRNMESMFSECLSLESLDVSRFNTEKVRNMESMFSHSGAVSLDISNFDMSNVDSFDDMFAGCNYLTDLCVGDKSKKVCDSIEESVFVKLKIKYKSMDIN